MSKFKFKISEMEIFVGKILFMKKVDAIDIHHGHKEMHFQENY